MKKQKAFHFGSFIQSLILLCAPCVLGVSSPTPSLAQTFTANPNPVVVPFGKTLGVTTLQWSAPEFPNDTIAVYAGSTLFAEGGSQGSAQTGEWVADGLTFTLTDLNTGQTLSTLIAHVQQGPAPSAVKFAPYGLDLEEFGCYPPAPCLPINQSITAGAQWVRIFVSWSDIEPNAPVGPANPSIDGQMSGQHTYNWNYVDTTVTAAVQSGLQVYLQIVWVPAWANGNPYPSCSPFSAGAMNQCFVDGKPVGNPQGYPPTNPLFLQDFAYSLAMHLNGTVSYFGPINEPNLTNNFNPEKLPDPNGEYLNYYITDFVRPVRAGIKAASAANQLVGPDVSLNGCGLPAKCAGGLHSWLEPLHKYFASDFDVWSLHSYHSNHLLVLLDMLEVNYTLSDVSNVWLTETGYSIGNGTRYQADQVVDTYRNNADNKSWWQKTFYHDLEGTPNLLPNQDDGLLDPEGVPRLAYRDYQRLTQANRLR